MIARIWSALFGPGNLGGTTGLVVSALVLGAHYSAELSKMEFVFWKYTLFGCAMGWAAGAIGGFTARHEFLREDWVDCRWLVGFCAGAVVGGFLVAILCDLWFFIAVTAGGAIGGLLDVIVHRGRLEEGE